MSKKGKIIIIVAPSGSGKSTLLKMLFRDIPELQWSVSTTTRDKRSGEVHGKDYFFTEKDSFQKGIENGDFIEWAEVHGNFYGTSKKTIDQTLEKGDFVICDLDVQGTDSMLNSFPNDAEAIFIEPPSVETLRKRLRGRATDETKVIELRLKNAEQELVRKNDYDYLVKNDNLDEAYAKLKSIVENIMSKARG